MTTAQTSPETSPGASPEIRQALDDADAAFARLDDALAACSDGDLHRAHRDGGWTVAQVVSHIHVCTIVWLGDLRRLECDPDLRFFFREAIGHDLTGYPPPTIEIAREQLASTRRTFATAGPVLDADLAAREVEIPDLGTMTVEAWTPLIVGHAASHVDQALEIMRDRGFGPEGI
ncbi:DinB family protein [Nocardioides lentus]|uniref:DinB family protein n=1 Tax=Nocardioides lentus TaxID=338077 RepID=UPI0031DE04EC